jgi:hypothetical protein
MWRRVLVTCLVVLAGSAGAVAANESVAGRPDLTLRLAAAEIEPGSVASLQVTVANAGVVLREASPELEERVTTARDLRLAVVTERLPESLAGAIRVKTPEVPVGTVPVGESDPVEIRLSVAIETVRPEGSNASGVQQIAVGDTMEVVGLTNRKPDDNTITVEVVDGPSANEFDTGSIDQWDGDGVWSVTLDTDDVEPGTYTIEVDDGDNTDTVQVQVVAAEAGGNETENASGNATATPAGNATGTENGSASLNGAGPAPATAGPVALVLLLVAALGTMTNRREE